MVSNMSDNVSTSNSYALLSKFSSCLLYIADVIHYLLVPCCWLADRINAIVHTINMIAVSKNIENKFTPLFFLDLAAGLFLWCCAFLIWGEYLSLYFDVLSQTIVVIVFTLWGFLFIRKGSKQWLYQHRLSFIAPTVMKSAEIPLIDYQKHPKGADLFVGIGYLWTSTHRQSLHTLVHQKLTSPWTAKIIVEAQHRDWVSSHLGHWQMQCPAFNALMQRLGFPLIPDLSGNPSYHALHDHQEKFIYASASDRKGHGAIIGTTGCGKTVGQSFLIVSDIRLGRLVIYIDPKGDLDILINMFCAAYENNRLADFIIIHLGQHDLSAKANIFGNYSDVSQIAGRMTSSMSQKVGDPFTASAWQAVNQTARALHEIGIRPDPASLHFYITRPIELLRRYCESLYPKRYPEFKETVKDITESILAENAALDAPKNTTEIQARNTAILEFVRSKMDELTDETSGAEIDHIDMVSRIDFELYLVSQKDSHHRDKMINNVFPLFEKINGTQQMRIFSYYWRDRIVKTKKGYKKLKEYDSKSILDNPNSNAVVYIGISALSNPTLSATAIRSILSDLTNYAGVMNDHGRKVGKDGQGAYVYIDETAEVANDEFIQLLNKSRGTGFKITWATQTLKDIAAAYDGNTVKAAQVIANSQGFKLIFRIKEPNDAKLICDNFDAVFARSTVPDSGVSDMQSHGFRSSNRDTLAITPVSLLTPEMLTSLPNGQAFFINAANEIYKVRFPIQVPDNPNFANEIDENDFVAEGNCFPETKIIRNIMKRVNFVDIDANQAESILSQPIDGTIVPETLENTVISQANVITDPKKTIALDEKMLVRWISERQKHINLEPFWLLYSTEPKTGFYLTVCFWQWFCQKENLAAEVDTVIEQAMALKIIDNVVYAYQRDNHSIEACFRYKKWISSIQIYTTMTGSIKAVDSHHHFSAADHG